VSHFKVFYEQHKAQSIKGYPSQMLPDSNFTPLLMRNYQQQSCSCRRGCG